MRYYNSDDFITLYPGVPSADEKEPFQEYLKYVQDLKTREPIDPEALVKGELPPGTPGIDGPFKVEESMVRYFNKKYDMENPLLHDKDYAIKAGYKDIQAYFTYTSYPQLLKPYPAQARGTLLVSQIQSSINSFKPIYPGDTLYVVYEDADIVDLTPQEGSLYRSLQISGKGTAYNQHGEKVQEMFSSCMESVKVYKPGLKPENMTFQDVWEDPDWMSRPAHYYTDEDWEFIFDIWRNEKRRGAEPLYWEDVKIGDEPQITTDGPILEGPLPSFEYGMGIGGSKNLKLEMLNPDIFKTMIRDPETGLYYMPDEKDWKPIVPCEIKEHKTEAGVVDETDIHKKTESRGVLLNFVGRDIAIRHINNWMGDHGWITNISWNIMPPETHAAYGKPVPKALGYKNYLDNVPYMKGKIVNAHGLSTDLPIVRSYVHNKYVKNGEHLVELAWWIETIDKYIFIAGNATVRLPSRHA